jgi:diacylglycerol O-acyltransferase / wax synthase
MLRKCLLPAGIGHQRTPAEAKRIDLAPVLRRKLVHVPLGLDFPYWVDADDIDFDYHIRATKLSGPAGDKELAEAVGQIVSEPFDHSHPLWQLHLIEGLAEDRSALVFKLVVKAEAPW